MRLSPKPVGGSGWSVVDQIGVLGYSAGGEGFTVDSNNNLYVAGETSDSVQGNYGFVRSMPGAPAPTTPAILSTAPISAAAMPALATPSAPAAAPLAAFSTAMIASNPVPDAPPTATFPSVSIAASMDDVTLLFAHRRRAGSLVL